MGEPIGVYDGPSSVEWHGAFNWEKVRGDDLREGRHMNWAKIKLGLWSAIGGAILLAIIGFRWGGWVTGGTAQQMATEMTGTAMVDRLAPFCLEQFSQDPEKDQKLEALKKVSSWQRRGYVEEQGWATMFGEKEPDHEVATECANLIMKAS